MCRATIYKPYYNVKIIVDNTREQHVDNNVILSNLW